VNFSPLHYAIHLTLGKIQRWGEIETVSSAMRRETPQFILHSGKFPRSAIASLLRCKLFRADYVSIQIKQSVYPEQWRSTVYLCIGFSSS